MQAYLQLVQKVLALGEQRPNRTEVEGTGLFGDSLAYDLREGFPLPTTKSVNFKAVMAELRGFLAGATSAAAFRQFGTKIWDANANETPSWVQNPHRKGEDDLGKIYGYQWRKMDSIKIVQNVTPNDMLAGTDLIKRGYRVINIFEAGGVSQFVMQKSIDQMQELIDGIKANPYGRRHIVTAWNPNDLMEMALPPCHSFFQCYVTTDGYLDLQMYQRSADLFLGVPFNIASYAALLMILAELTGLKPRMLKLVFGDLHIYDNHRDQCETQLMRMPRELPEATICMLDSLDTIPEDAIQIHGYEPDAAIPAPMAK